MFIKSRKKTLKFLNIVHYYAYPRFMTNVL